MTAGDPKITASSAVIDRRSARPLDPIFLLRGFWLVWLAAYLLLDLPVGEEVLVAASRALPGSLHRIRTPLVEHLHNQVTVQTHGRMTVDHFRLCRFSHNCQWKPPFSLRALYVRLHPPNGCKLMTYNSLTIERSANCSRYRRCDY